MAKWIVGEVSRLRALDSVAVTLIWLGLTGCASISPVNVEEVSSPTPVRIEVSSGTIPAESDSERTAQFRGFDAERVYISFPANSVPDTIPWNEVRNLTAYNGRNTGFGIFLGAGGGLVVGALGMAILGGLGDSSDGAPLFPVPLITIPVGAVLGAIWAPEAWASVRRPE